MAGQTTCRIDGCDRKRWMPYSLCASHRRRLVKLGDPLAEYPDRRLPDGTIRPADGADPDGYQRILTRGHPMASGKGWIPLHRYVMAEHLGRMLEADESVHHRNGRKNDNAIGNLELWAGVGRQPSGQRPAELVAWAVEILGRYGADVAAGKL